MKIGRNVTSRSRAGSSVVEVMIALSMFGLFTAGTCRMLVAHRKILDSARDHYIAANLAKDRIELARTKWKSLVLRPLSANNRNHLP